MALDGRKIAAVLALAVGLSGAILAVSPTIGAMVLAPGGEVLRTLGHAGAKRPSPARLQRAIAGHRTGLSWYADAGGWAALGALHIALARETTLAPRARSAHYDLAVTAVRNALMLSPALPFAWFHYAYAALARDGGDARIDAPLIMSINAAPKEPSLVKQRIRIGFIAHRVLAPETRAAVRLQVLIAARGGMADLVRFAHRERAFAWVRNTLAGEPALRQDFDIAYLRASRIR
ncbi:MAG: hypothetical protein GEU92_12795 [Alphaproteobacteria bacterium]|nr:hypothetical protein [Alphaproteobacteria bacterium]